MTNDNERVRNDQEGSNSYAGAPPPQSEAAGAPPVQMSAALPDDALPAGSSEFQESLRTGIHGLGPLKAPTSAWNEDEQPRPSRRKTYAKWLSYSLLGVVTFLFFLYNTFPYGVLKEVVVDRMTQEIQKAGLPIRVSIERLSPYWLRGIEMNNVSIRNVTHPAAHLVFKRARMTFNPLALLLGRLSLAVSLKQADGSMDLGVSLPLSTLLSGAPSPRSATVELQSFALDPLFNHALAFAAGSKDPGMLLVAPLVAKTTIGGKLTGKVEFSNTNPEHFGDATGQFELSVEDGFLHIADETLKIRRQSFQTANLDLNFGGSALNLGQNTKFAAEDVEIELNGRITLPDLNKQPAQVNLNMSLTMREKILDTLGFIVPNMLRCPAMNNGVLKVNLTGPLSGMACSAI